MKCVAGRELQVCHSAAGFYIGTLEDGMPYCRMSSSYFSNKEDAEKAMQDTSAMKLMGRSSMETEFCNGGMGCVQ